MADNITIPAEELSNFSLDPLLNDSLPSLLFDDIEVGYEFLPIEVEGCFQSTFNFDTYQGFLLTGDPTDTSDCCGIYQIPYSVLTYGPWWNGCLLTDTITVNVVCEEKGDCSWIDLNAVTSDEDSTCIPVCEGAITTITAPYNPLLDYTWDITGGSVTETLDNEANVKVQWDDEGSGLIALTTSLDGILVNTLTQCLDIHPTPNPSFSSANTACLDVPVAFQSLSDNSALHYWEFGDGATSTEVNPNHTFSAPGLQTVTLFTTTPLLDEEGNELCCCTRQFSQDIEVLDLVGASIECRSTLCEGDSACYWTNDGCANASYAWSVTDASGNPVNFDGQGTPEICLQWGEGPIGEVSLLLTGCGNACPEPSTLVVPIIASTADISGPDVACEQEVATYSVPKWMDVQYNWTVTGALSYTVNGHQVTIHWGNAGPGTVEVTYASPFLSELPNQGSGACSGSGNLTVDIRPELSFLSTVEQSCVGQPVGFTANTSDVQWSTSSNGDATNGAFFSTTLNNTGAHVITAMAMDAASYCQSSIQHTVQVSALPPIEIVGPSAGCANTEFIYGIDPLPLGTNLYWSTSGGTNGAGTGPGFSTAWNTGATNAQVQVDVIESQGPGCTAQATLSFETWTPGSPLSLDHFDACANQLDTFQLALSQQGVGETLTWSISPPHAGSIADGQGTQDVVIQWNDFSGTATVSVLSEICDLQASNTFSIEVHPTPEVAIVQEGDLCSGALNPATLGISPNYAELVWTLPDVFSDNDSLITNLTSTDSELDSLFTGIYSVDITDAWGCTNSTSYSVTPTPAPNVDIHAAVGLPMCTSASMDVTLFATTSADWTHEWSTGSSDASTIYSATGIPSFVSVTTTDGTTGCFSTSSRNMEIECSGGGGGGGCTPSESLSPSLTATCAEVTVSTGCGNCTNVLWNYGDGSGSTNLADHVYTEAGCYSVTATGQVPSTTPSENCTISESIITCIPLASYFNATRISCTEYSFEELATFLDIPGEDNVIDEWSWTFGDGGVSSDPNPTHDFLTQGVFEVTLTVHAINGCTASHAILLDLGYAPDIQVDLDAPICQGSPSFYSATALGAVQTQWSIPDGVSFQGSSLYHTFSSLPSGMEVDVTVTSAQGCVAATQVPIDVHPEPTDPLAGVSDDILCHDPGFTVISSASGFNDHQWYDQGVAILGETNDVLSADAGTYHVMATDANGCQATSGSVHIQVRPNPNPVIQGPSLVCGNDNPVVFSVHGNYDSYDWYEGTSQISNEGTIEVSPFSYPTLEFQVVVVDSDNCSHTSDVFTVDWEPLPEISLSTPVSPPCAANDFPISVLNPDPNMGYFWAHGAEGPNVQVDQAGVYSVVGVAQSGCVANATLEVLPVPDLCSVPSGCYETCDPTQVCGPASLAAYQWWIDSNPIPGGNAACIDISESGTVQLMATDNQGCTAMSEPLDLVVVPCGCAVESDLTPNVDCCVGLGFNNASTVSLTSLSLHTDGDTATFTSHLSANPVNQGADFVELVYDLGDELPQGNVDPAITICFNSPGEHHVIWEWTHEDGGTCSDTLTYVQPGVALNVTAETCPGDCNGAIVPSVTSSPEWTSTLSDALGQPTDGSALCPGTYVHTLTDGGACVLTDSIDVVGPLPFSMNAVAEDAACSGGTGQICITEFSGGSGPLEVNVLPASEPLNDSCFSVFAGPIQVILNDSLGCLSLPIEWTISEPEPIQPFVGIDPISCSGEQDGALIFDALGGTGNVSLASPFVVPNLPDTLFNQGPGSLALIFEDEAGCTDTTEVVLVEPDEVQLELLSLTPIECFNACTGSIEVEWSGGTGGLQFHLDSIHESTLASALDLLNLCSDTVSMFVVDDNGCSDSLEVFVDSAPVLAFTIATENITCTGMTDGSAQVVLTGGTGALSWFQQGDSLDLDQLPEGSVDLIGVDASGCLVDTTFTIGADVATDMVLQLFTTPVSCWQTDDGTATAAVTGGHLPILYQWNDPAQQTTSTAIGLQQDEYAITITDQIGCTLSDVVTVEGNEDCLFIADAITPNGDGINDVWVIGGLEFFPRSTVRVFNRWGQIVFDSSPWSTLWDGRFNGNLLPSGDYYYVITPVPGSEPITGTISLKY